MDADRASSLELAFLGETLTDREKSLLGRKENQNKKRTSRACGQRHLARGIPAGLGHTSGWGRSLCMASKWQGPEQGPGQLEEALPRTGKGFPRSYLSVNSRVSFFHAQLSQKAYIFLSFLLLCLAFALLSFPLKQPNQNKPAESVQTLHNLPELAELAETLVLSSEVTADLRSTFVRRLAHRSIIYTARQL